MDNLEAIFIIKNDVKGIFNLSKHGVEFVNFITTGEPSFIFPKVCLNITEVYKGVLLSFHTYLSDNVYWVSHEIRKTSIPSTNKEVIDVFKTVFTEFSKKEQLLKDIKAIL